MAKRTDWKTEAKKVWHKADCAECPVRDDDEEEELNE